MPKNTQILLFSNLAVLLLLHFFYHPTGQGGILLYPPVVWLLFNIVAGGIIFFINRELGKAFFLFGLTVLLIGGSVCGLGIMLWKTTR